MLQRAVLLRVAIAILTTACASRGPRNPETDPAAAAAVRDDLRLVGRETTWVARGPNQRAVGQIPKNWRPGAGAIITGVAADKARAAALAEYPGGTVNRVLQLADSSYAVHMIKISWPHHIFVSKNFKVTGVIG